MRQLAQLQHQNRAQVGHREVTQTGGRKTPGQAKTALPEFLAGPR